MRKISASEAAKLAAEQAEKARLALLQRNAEAAERRARVRQRQTIAVTAVGAVLVVIAMIGVAYVALTPPEPPPLLSRQASSDQFAATRVGIIRYGEGRQRNRCRQVDFSNNGGELSNETTVPCTDPRSAMPDPDEPALSSPASRLDGIRGGFAKR